MQTQGSTAKKFKPKEFRPKDSKLADEKTSVPLHINEPKKTSRQDKKKEYHKKKRDLKISTSTIGDNVIEVEKKQNNWGDKKCYNFQKKGYFARNCPESL